MFRYLDSLKGNRLYECLLCGKKIWHSKTRAHVTSAHRDRLDEFEVLAKTTVLDKPSSEVKGQAQYSPVFNQAPPPPPATPDAASTLAAAAGATRSAAPGDAAATSRATPVGTPVPTTTTTPAAANLSAQAKKLLKQDVSPDKLNEAVARFLAARRLPLDLGNDPNFQDVLAEGIALGAIRQAKAFNGKIVMPTRKSLTEASLEGDKSLFAVKVSQLKAQMKLMSVVAGASLVTLRGLDAGGNLIDVVAVRIGSNQCLFLTRVVSDGMSERESLVETILSGDTKRLYRCVLDNDVAITTASSSKRRKKSDPTGANEQLSEFIPGAVAVGGLEKNAGLQLQKQHALLTFACANDAFTKCLSEMFAVPHIKQGAVVPSRRIISAFTDRDDMRELWDKIVPNKQLLRFRCERAAEGGAFEVTRILELKESIKSICSSKSFDDIVAGTTDTVAKAELVAVKALAGDDLFWRTVEFSSRLAAGFIFALRLLDGHTAGLMCLVYKLWSINYTTVKSVLEEAAFSQFQAHSKTIWTVLEKFCREDHEPVHSAAFFLCPHLHNNIAHMLTMDPALFATVLAETLATCVLVFRRFDEHGRPRASILSDASPAVKEAEKWIKEELQSYVKGRGTYSALSSDTYVDGLGKRTPWDWWELDCLNSPLRYIASKITSLSSNITVPLGDMLKSIKTGSPRDVDSYRKTLDLNFLAVEYNKGKKRTPVDWATIAAYKDVAGNLSSADMKWIETEAQRDAAEWAAAEHIIEEGLSSQTSAKPPLQAVPPSHSTPNVVSGSGKAKRAKVAEEPVDVPASATKRRGK